MFVQVQNRSQNTPLGEEICNPRFKFGPEKPIVLIWKQRNLGETISTGNAKGGLMNQIEEWLVQRIPSRATKGIFSQDKRNSPTSIGSIQERPVLAINKGARTELELRITSFF